MFGLGMQELAIIFLVVLIIFGAGKLPQIGSGIGKGINNFRKSIRGEDDNSSSNRTKIDNDKSGSGQA
ncbi:MAG: twin-arginine translocase TatA/TatE family subunit [Pseudomonadota bacterium]